MCIAQAADIFGAGLVAGAFFMGAFAVHPAAARLDVWPHGRGPTRLTLNCLVAEDD
jgi:hypothetical protein